MGIVCAWQGGVALPNCKSWASTEFVPQYAAPLAWLELHLQIQKSNYTYDHRVLLNYSWKLNFTPVLHQLIPHWMFGINTDSEGRVFLTSHSHQLQAQHPLGPCWGPGIQIHWVELTQTAILKHSEKLPVPIACFLLNFKKFSTDCAHPRPSKFFWVFSSLLPMAPCTLNCSDSILTRSGQSRSQKQNSPKANCQYLPIKN